MPIKIRETHIRANFAEEDQQKSQEALPVEAGQVVKVSATLEYYLQKLQWRNLKSREER